MVYALDYLTIEKMFIIIHLTIVLPRQVHPKYYGLVQKLPTGHLYVPRSSCTGYSVQSNLKTYRTVIRKLIRSYNLAFYERQSFTTSATTSLTFHSADFFACFMLTTKETLEMRLNH